MDNKNSQFFPPKGTFTESVCFIRLIVDVMSIALINMCFFFVVALELYEMFSQLTGKIFLQFQAAADYRIAHNLPASQVHQLARPLYPQLVERSQHAPQSQPYLITSPPGTNPSLVRFPTRVYQSSSGQATGFFPQ